MGNKSSKKSKIDHTDCDCKLYKEYKHCCRKQCLYYANREEQKNQLLISLKNYNVEYIINVVMEYLPEFGLIKAQNDNDTYRAYIHSNILDINYCL